MSKTNSPLRYPGGKACLLKLVSGIIKTNHLDRWHYAEPYAGGCGLALSLLYGGYVSDIHINDYDPSIYCFWNSVLDHTDEFIELVKATKIDLDEWQKQKEIQIREDSSDPLSLGFATFFLNRTNRSGIIKGAGMIGGRAQSGKYKLDCRFNKENLVQRIRRIARYRTQIHLTGLDAIEFVKGSCKLPEDTFFCIDPPYYMKGSMLYTSFYGPEDHQEVSREIVDLENPWIVTYDNVPEIRKLYSKRRQFVFDINYSVQNKRVGTELLIASKGLRIPSEIKTKSAELLLGLTA